MSKRDPAKAQEQRRSYYSKPKGRAAHLLSHARLRAAAKGIPLTITQDWIAERIAAGQCEVTRIPFVLTTTGDGPSAKSPWTPSLDQREPGAGYTPENTQVVCWAYNAAKSDFSAETLMTLAKALVRG